MPLEPPDTHHLDAATGWLMLGNAVEARKELEAIRAELRSRPEVLDLEWRLLAHEKRWLEASQVGKRMVENSPDDATAWVHRSFALHELRQTREALQLLLPAAQKFPQDTVIPYNLACYTCQLGDLVTARCWFDQSLALCESNLEKIARISAALEDPDLQPLWADLKKRLDTIVESESGN